MPFPGGSDDKESASNMGNPGLIPGSGRPPGEGGGHPFSYSCLENPMGGGAWWATVDGVAQSLGMEWLTLRWDTRLSVLRSECIQTHKQQKWPWTSGQPAPHLELLGVVCSHPGEEQRPLPVTHVMYVKKVLSGSKEWFRKYSNSLHSFFLISVSITETVRGVTWLAKKLP